jgi:hypothetical protein
MKSQSVIPKADAELAKWCAALQEPSIEVAPVPQGWMTAEQIGNATKRERSTVSNRIKKLAAQGKAEMRRFHIMTARGVYPVPHYRLK